MLDVTPADIALRMEKMGLTQKALSERAGVSTFTISKFLSGFSVPRDETLSKIASAVYLPGFAPDEPETDGKPREDVSPRFSPHLVVSAANALGVKPRQIRQYIRKGASWGKEIGAGRSTYMIDRQQFLNEFGVLLDIPQTRFYTKEDGNGDEAAG